MSTKADAVKYFEDLIAEKQARKDQFDEALTHRKGTVARFWKLLSDLKGVAADFNRKGKNPSGIMSLIKEKQATLKQHEEMVVSLRSFYKGVSDEILELEKLKKAVEE